MKKLVIFIIAGFFLTGCATVKLTTDIGGLIGTSYKISADKGIISAEQSIKAWPYVSGVLKGLLAGDYALIIPPIATQIISNLDSLAGKENLTTEEKGYVIGSYVRLEAIAIQDNWDRYGVSIISLVTKKIAF